MSGTIRQREQQLLTTIAEKSNAVKAIWDKVGDATLDAETKKTALDLENEIKGLEDQVKEIREQAGMYEANERRQKEYNQPAPGERLPTPKGSERGDEIREQAKSLGEQFTSNDAFKGWLNQIAPKGHVPDRVKLQSPGVEVSSKTLLTGASSTSAGALVVNERLNIIDDGTFKRPLTVLDLISKGTTSSDTAEYVRQGTHTNNAAAVAEATATGDGTGAKPESAMVLSIVTEVAKTIAHWIPATRRALADAGQLRSLIDTFLRYGLDEELEDQILNGNGVGENFTGIYNTPNTSTQAWDTNILTTTRKARTKVRTLGRATPNGYLLHPTDWETIDLLQDNEARYYFGGPSAIGAPRLWGLPVVESEANAVGFGLCADFRLAALWDREQTQILVSDSHSDFFIRNLIAILAELRAIFGVIRPAAFVEMDLTA
jgi:HK97 family phage major capsid protein